MRANNSTVEPWGFGMTKSPETFETASPSSHWILLRGLARESRHWGSFAQELARVIPGARVDALDLPGTGCFSEMRSPISVPAITDFVRDKFLERRESWERESRESRESPGTRLSGSSSTMPPAHLVAVSLGGMVAADWLERYPDDFVSGVMINTSFRGLSPLSARLAPTSYLHLLNIMRSRDTYQRERHVLRMVSNRPEIREVTAREWAAIYDSRPVSHENFFRQLLAAGRYEPSGRAPGIPVLVLNSARDRMVDPSCSELIAQRWNAEIRRHPTAGHDLPLDAGGWVIDQIRDFWEEMRSKVGDKI